MSLAGRLLRWKCWFLVLLSGCEGSQLLELLQLPPASEPELEHKHVPRLLQTDQTDHIPVCVCVALQVLWLPR